MHVVYEGMEKEAEDDAHQHKTCLQQQPSVRDVILQVDMKRFIVASNTETFPYNALVHGPFLPFFPVLSHSVGSPSFQISYKRMQRIQCFDHVDDIELGVFHYTVTLITSSCRAAG